MLLELTPHIADYIWGGRRLREFGVRSDLPRLAEAWVLSCHKAGESIVEGGAYGGLPLSAAIAKRPGCLGVNAARFDSFPLLIKLIDAARPLSVQVHPDDAYALAHEGEYGKTEMWYVLDAAPGAFLYYGFVREISKEEFAVRIAAGTLEEALNRVEVRPGDCVLIEAGTLHAIGAGILIAEVQQNSNTTYRVFDYGRAGDDGKPRALHIRQALDVTVRTPPRRPVGAMGAPVPVPGGAETLLTACDIFAVTKLDVRGTMTRRATERSFVSLLCAAGSGSIRADGDKREFRAGGSFFVPAGSGEIELTGGAVMLQTEIAGDKE